MNKLKSVQTNFIKKIDVIKEFIRKTLSGIEERNVNKRQFVLCMDEYPQTQKFHINDDK
jgi:hypothetical protein